MRIRRATVEDLPTIHPLFVKYLQFYERDSSGEKPMTFLTENLLESRSTIFVAENDKRKLCGFTQLYQRLSSLSMGHYIYLSDLYVNETCRKQGLGKALMDAAKEYAISIDAVKIELNTAHTNIAAQSLYESLEYQMDRDYRTYILMLKK
ncbi:MAG: GNAT family N-acetyltransferase [Candidatus Obscuribacterales bacterium]|nr:GNAT family N-acetyltransferase [Candidatus Obscuribacterales bacterium]